MRNSVLIIFLSITFFGCNSQQDEPVAIDYSALSEVSYELILEIGDSENFIPADLRELIVTPDRNLVVSDRGSQTIEQFDSNGMHLGTVASEGSGPGELNNFFTLVDLKNERMLVNQQGGQKDYFVRDDRGLFSYDRSDLNENRDTQLNIIGPYPEGEYFAQTITRSNIQNILESQKDYSTQVIVLADLKDNIIADSLHILKSAMPHFTQINNAFTFNTIPYLVGEKFLLLDDHTYMIARPDSSALFIYNKTHELNQRIELPVKSRPVTDKDLDYHLKDVRRQIRKEIELRVSDAKPPFLAVWASGDTIWLHTDTREDGKEFILFDFKGAPKGKITLPEATEVKDIKNELIYTFHKDPDYGDSIRIYEVAI